MRKTLRQRSSLVIAKTLTLLQYLVSQLFKFFQVFTIAPVDGNSSTLNELNTSRLALAVRIHPIDANGPPTCLRVGAYGTKGMDRALVYYAESNDRQVTVKPLYNGQGTFCPL